MTPVTTTIISCEQRHAARALTIPQLEAAGYPPTVFLSPCNPAGARGNAAVTRRALNHAKEAGGHLLFCEDDIDLAPDFPTFVSMAASVPDRITYLYIHDTPERMHKIYGLALNRAIQSGKPLARGLYPTVNTVDLMGGQCVFIPKGVLDRMNPDQLIGRGIPCDHYFAAVVRNQTPGALIALPHPVQHRHDRTAREPSDNPNKRSMSFALPRLEVTP